MILTRAFFRQFVAGVAPEGLLEGEDDGANSDPESVFAKELE